ncbi:hypothetical protein L1887_21030 [Cichorium endivia]|nr:hypothetical protein L1887_21030 [Cichorium endivia]
MGSIDKPHAVCIPFPAQGHINPMLKLAKILHSKGFHITFVNTEFNHQRLLKSQGPDTLSHDPSFKFETIPDGLPPPENLDATQDIPTLCKSTSESCLEPFKKLLMKLNDTTTTPPVSCIISDGAMSFTLDAADELGIPEVLFWTTSACGFLAYVHYSTLTQKGFIPLKDSADLTNGYLDTVVDCIPSMKGMRLKDMPSFLRTTDPDEFMVNYIIRETTRAKQASAIILNTFEDLEYDVLQELSLIYPAVYSIGPLHTLAKNIENKDLELLSSSLWKEEAECLEWLDSKKSNSVVYVNFGSIAVMTPQQLVEFSWGLANSNQSFLWVIRPDLVYGDSPMLPPEFLDATSGRGLLASWCPQEKVLNHPSIGGFLTHSGWNSTLESISSGVPMICWPFFAEQQTNCWYSCNRWGIGMEIDSAVDRKQVEKLVNILMDGEKGKDMKRMAEVWKKKAESMSSWMNIDNLIKQVLLQSSGSTRTLTIALKWEARVTEIESNNDEKLLEKYGETKEASTVSDMYLCSLHASHTIGSGVVYCRNGQVFEFPMILPFAESFLHPSPSSHLRPAPTIAAPSSAVAGFAVHNPNSSRERSDIVRNKLILFKGIEKEITFWSESEMTPCSSSFSSIASNGTPNSKSSIELVKEITSLETEIAHLERYLLSLYHSVLPSYFCDYKDDGFYPLSPTRRLSPPAAPVLCCLCSSHP